MTREDRTKFVLGLCLIALGVFIVIFMERHGHVTLMQAWGAVASSGGLRK